jgi:hypothetical protein
MEKDNLNEITNIQVPCIACEKNEEKPCEYCPWWQFSQLAYIKMKIDPIKSVEYILSGANRELEKN